ncbi:MAG: response regulator transcription factor [Anaerolineae bacterium]|nr:response regulator transcription factor [Anaerolineae bacterium]MCO5199868.1 response regulator transcription factor [Anaerolineae bacterium]
MTEFDEGLHRILAVDDNQQTVRIIEIALRKAGFEVVTANSGSDALNLIKRRGMPHLAIVDLNMPRMSGFEFCKAVHRFSDLPVIILTAVSDEKTVIEEIEQYAEDYIVKPFSPAELVARVRRILRRIGDFGYTLDPIVRVDDILRIDFPNRTAFVNDKEVSMTPTETKLLYLMLHSAGRIVTSDYLMRRIWPFETANEDRLHVHVHRLRRKIEYDPKHPHYIVSERGLGYIFPAPKTE